MSKNTPTIAASSVPLCISSIDIRLDDTSKKKVDFAELKLDSQRRKIHHSSEPGKNLSAKFDPAIKDILAETVDPSGQREYSTVQRKMTVAITTISQSQSTSRDILENCPRFRLLVIGNTGVGKSTLIRQAFKLNEHVADYECGKANINEEFTAPENERFVVHDSQGFEAGDSENFAIAKDFIKRRRNMLALQDKIHAVWLCISIPLANEALFEDGIEEFIKLRKEILGDIPIIVVFTKYDTLVNDLELEARMSGEHDETALEARKVDKLNELCIQPLKEVAGSDILHTTVSMDEEYESTIRRLIDLTTTSVEEFVASEAALVMMIAQRADIGLKVKASLIIGNRRYWRGLAANVNFKGFTMSDCLSVIHKDVIDVWNFNDPHCHLASDQFKGLILKDLDKADEPMPKVPDMVDLPWTAAQPLNISSEFGLATITAILTLLAGAFPPIAAGVALVECARDAYQHTKIVLQRIMTYIVDLTCVMQILFLLAPTGPISRHVVKIATKAYEEACKNKVHLAIQSYCVSAMSTGEGDALETIVRMIKDHSIQADEVQGLRARMEGPVDSKADEEW
ncbi:uncharacterized protein F5147DRAFT_657772 [Suillus discolor]|uniref:G domain-containing protein n=1 Tax=Suillus discolor TaxID=1912936 RepID=A0A9P7EWK4_9AGAM|nr:uncharacterized protein F5147DRAFT_657772 [Suillus discolor]KAG2092156.1 hypothetical protein F5147DRAFT_657772 [Suillus discolor]